MSLMVVAFELKEVKVPTIARKITGDECRCELNKASSVS